MKHIPSEALTLDMFPDTETCEDYQLWTFAHTFDAYTYWGGLNEAFVALQKVSEWQEVEMERLRVEEGVQPEWFPYPDREIDYLRTHIFLACRASRYGDDPPPDYFWKSLRDTVARIRDLMVERVWASTSEHASG